MTPASLRASLRVAMVAFFALRAILWELHTSVLDDDAGDGTGGAMEAVADELACSVELGIEEVRLDECSNLEDGAMQAGLAAGDDVDLVLKLHENGGMVVEDLLLREPVER